MTNFEYVERKVLIDQRKKVEIYATDQKLKSELQKNSSRKRFIDIRSICINLVMRQIILTYGLRAAQNQERDDDLEYRQCHLQKKSRYLGIKYIKLGPPTFKLCS